MARPFKIRQRRNLLKWRKRKKNWNRRQHVISLRKKVIISRVAKGEINFSQADELMQHITKPRKR